MGNYAGNNRVVDRGKSGVHYRSMDTFPNFVEARRPRCIDTTGGTNIDHAPPNKVSKIELVIGRVSAKVRGVPVSAARLGEDSTGATIIDGIYGHEQDLLHDRQQRAVD